VVRQHLLEFARWGTRFYCPPGAGLLTEPARIAGVWAAHHKWEKKIH
jgi:hypothetical protein